MAAVFVVAGAAAQQQAAPPAQQAPAETKAPEAQPPEAAKPAQGTQPTGADPVKMAAPHQTRNKNVPPSAVDNSGYILGPEDQIAVFVFQGPEFSSQHMIRPDGKITINLIGDVQAAGLSPEALANAISEKLKTYVNDPDVTVSVLAVKSKKYSINGEVNKPGEYPLVVPTRVFQALVNAGGFRDFANQKKITIIHEDGTRNFFNYKEVLNGKKLEQNILVRPGDIIVVK
ncbi:MAG: polysaccharide biosynthesis/export family protein [Acidobacteria bacterium]|nr:polysaccharide biosynthesis/export family protein [Acidobacteriota bacterium]